MRSVTCPDCGGVVDIPTVTVGDDSLSPYCKNCLWEDLDSVYTKRRLIVWSAGYPATVDDVTIVTTVRLPTDQTFSSTTPADVVGLKFSLGVGIYYHFRFVIIASGPAITTGSQVGLALSVTNPAVTVFATDPISTKMGFDELGQSSSNYIVTYEGLILPSASGTLQLQAATTFGTSTITVKQGSAGFMTLIT